MPHKHSSHKHSSHKHGHTDKKHKDRNSPVHKHFHSQKDKHDPSVLNQFKGKIRFIENLRGRYAGKEIWVFATGPSLDDLPEDFLSMDNKICIAVKEAAMPFPNCTYNIWPFRDYPLRHVYLPRGKIPRKFRKFIFTIRNRDRDNYYGEQSSKAIFLRYVQGGTIGKMKTMCESIIAGNSSVYYGVGTITHLAIAAAVVMGASKVSLVGCDHGSIDGKLRFQRGISGGHGWQLSYAKPYEDMRVGTNFLANFFRGHGIEIVRYYHGRGYEGVGDVVKNKETIKRAEGAWKDILKKTTFKGKEKESFYLGKTDSESKEEEKDVT